MGMPPIAEVPSPGSGRRKDLELEPRYATEDAVIGDKRNPETHGGGGDPAVGVVCSLAQGVSNPLAVHPQLGVGEDELRSGMDNLSDGNLGLELEHSYWSPRPQ